MDLKVDYFQMPTLIITLLKIAYFQVFTLITLLNILLQVHAKHRKGLSKL